MPSLPSLTRLTRESRIGLGLAILGLAGTILFPVGIALGWHLGHQAILAGLAVGAALAVVGIVLVVHGLFRSTRGVQVDAPSGGASVQFRERMPQVIPEVEINTTRVDERVFVVVTNPGPIAAQFGAEITEMRYSPDPFHFPIPVRWYGSLSALHTIPVRENSVLEFARIDGDDDAILFLRPGGQTRVGSLRKDGVGCPFLELTLRVFAVGSPQDQFKRLSLQLREPDDYHEGRYLLAHQFARD
jgi:hypothetical protein